MKRAAIAITCLAVAAVILVGSWNYLVLMRPAAEVRAQDPRNAGIEFNAYFGNFVDASTLVVDLRAVGAENSPMDVFRVLLQFAAQVKDRQFTTVKLAHRGETKFLLKGEYFAQLGHEYGTQNPVYTIRTLPENLYLPDGRAAFGTWTGGVFGVLQKQMEDVTEFHRRWYIEDLAGPG